MFVWIRFGEVWFGLSGSHFIDAYGKCITSLIGISEIRISEGVLYIYIVYLYLYTYILYVCVYIVYMYIDIYTFARIVSCSPSTFGKHFFRRS